MISGIWLTAVHSDQSPDGPDGVWVLTHGVTLGKTQSSLARSSQGS